jgi:hypothetical protein
MFKLPVQDKASLQKRITKPVLEQSQTKQSAGPASKHIDFGFPTYDFDDGCYELLPSKNYPIDPLEHRQAMVRFVYKLCCGFSLTSELAPYIPDIDKIQAQFFHSAGGITNYSFQKNEQAHLFFQEISLLFGGHELITTGIHPIHQVRHMDGEDNEHVIDTNPNLKDKFKAGSFIIPLESERSIYHCSPEMMLMVKKGQVLVFAGNFAHGGITYREDPWFPAIHGHIDSIHHMLLVCGRRMGHDGDRSWR